MEVAGPQLFDFEGAQTLVDAFRHRKTRTLFFSVFITPIFGSLQL